ncbi:Rha family transcriptional regulator [Sporosarcina sp. FA9]|uniref:Rha family transcriptional regulator n=1 Tax=Sporosarcina sp. FA9 TaxID=3413030 RepID=UPI003F65DDD4
MNQLKVVFTNGQLVTDSRDVAEMVDREHNALLKSIRSYLQYLTQGGFARSEFFIENTYQDPTGRTLPSFLLTKKGCDMVANKMTGEKGVLFTATYVTRFEEMEKTLNAPKVLSSTEQLRASMRLSLETSEDVEVLKEDVALLKEKVENQITLDHGEQRGLQKAIGRKVFECAKSDDHKRLLYPELHREIKDRFGVTSYKDVRRQDLTAAIGYVNAWIPKRVA